MERPKSIEATNTNNHKRKVDRWVLSWPDRFDFVTPSFHELQPTRVLTQYKY
jgi:hypothetical protein